MLLSTILINNDIIIMNNAGIYQYCFYYISSVYIRESSNNYLITN